jgi:hypothetical protein
MARRDGGYLRPAVDAGLRSPSPTSFHIANLRALRIAREQRDRPRLIEFRSFQHKELSMKQRVATVLLWMFTIALRVKATRIDLSFSRRGDSLGKAGRRVGLVR